MNNPLRSEEGQTLKARSLLLFSSTIRFLSSLINLTEEEEENAGIYLGSQYENIESNTENKENIQ